MREHHRKLIQAEAEAWESDAQIHGTNRNTNVYLWTGGLVVALVESNSNSRREIVIQFDDDEVPLSPRMIRERFADPFGEKSPK